ncbi:sugar phosphate isomerase/epimerase [Rubripirellula sp.]|jgi:inosose dehydratase|nr:sugar phosphate isomerase/epimerase family protein [Rubripirellula sp.]MDB4749474.1 sugar phosphate isomerase/epimerase [Rubripirellula sp.]
MPTPTNIQCSRRQFIGSSSAAVVITGLPQRRASLAQSPDDRFGGWPVGIQSFSLRKFNVDEAIRHMQGLGLHFVEFYSKHVPLNSTPQQLVELSRKLDIADIKMSSHGVNRFTDDHESNKKTFEFAKRAGLRNITANPQPNAFDSLDKLVAEFDIRICIHNHGPGSSYDKIDEVVTAVKDRDPRIGACIDTGHFIRSGEDPIEAVKRLGNRVFALHIKDEEKQEKKSRNVIIGNGFLDVAKLFTTLKKVGFPADGSISLEYEANPQNPIDDIQECLTVAEEAIAKSKS